jgi:alpha-N-arabinofuranosidase
VPFIGIGNETWAAAANMRPDYAADINRRYATFANTPREMGSLKIASGSRNDVYDFAETMMRDGGRFDGLSVHYYTVPRIFRDKGRHRLSGKRMGFDLSHVPAYRRDS